MYKDFIPLREIMRHGKFFNADLFYQFSILNHLHKSCVGRYVTS